MHAILRAVFTVFTRSQTKWKIWQLSPNMKTKNTFSQSFVNQIIVRAVFLSRDLPAEQWLDDTQKQWISSSKTWKSVETEVLENARKRSRNALELHGCRMFWLSKHGFSVVCWMTSRMKVISEESFRNRSCGNRAS